MAGSDLPAPLSFHDHGTCRALLPRDGLLDPVWRSMLTLVYRDLVPDTAALMQRLAALPAFRHLPERWQESLRQFRHQVVLNDLALIRRLDSADGETTRLLFHTRAGLPVESVILRHRHNPFSSAGSQAAGPGRSTVCLSTQSGCALGCRFCATGALGGGTNLGSGEIISQAWTAASILHSEGRRLRNAVFMGMGEPLLNFTALKAAIAILTDHRGFNLAARRITVSTAGIVPGIRQLAAELPAIGLAISLHAPNDQLRRQLMPIARRWSLPELLQAIGEHERVSPAPVWYEYLMLAGLNDQAGHARELAALLAGHRAEVNLIPWNPVASPQDGSYAPSPRPVMEAFRDQLKAAGLPATIRHPMGADIDAACGQLAQKNASLATS